MQHLHHHFHHYTVSTITFGWPSSTIDGEGEAWVHSNTLLKNHAFSMSTHIRNIVGTIHISQISCENKYASEVASVKG